MGGLREVEGRVIEGMCRVEGSSSGNVAEFGCQEKFAARGRIPFELELELRIIVVLPAKVFQSSSIEKG